MIQIIHVRCRTYAQANALHGTGKICMRPWMFNPRRDFGLKGILEPDVCSTLCSLILMKNFNTDATVAGTEYLAVTPCRPHWMEWPAHNVSHHDIGADSALHQPGETFVVKGWSRMVCALGIIRCAFECPEFFQATANML